MVVSSRGAGFGWGGPLDDDIHRLVEMVTELGIGVEDILLSGLMALLGEGSHGARQAQKACDECEGRYQMAHHFGLELLLDDRATPEQTRRIVELQQISLAFRRIAQAAKRIAEQSLTLQPGIDEVVAHVGASMDLLEYLIKQTRVHLRNAILYSTSRDRNYARVILEEDADMRRAYMILESRVQEAISEQPRTSFPMQQLLGIATWLDTIGRDCYRIANSVLYDPPNKH